MNGKIFSVIDDTLLIETHLFSAKFSNVSGVKAEMCDNNGLSLPYMDAAAEWQGMTRHFCVWNDLSVVYMPEYKENVLTVLEGEHYTVECIRLHAFSDENDTLVTKEEYCVFAKKLFPADVRGDIFFIRNIVSGNAITVISETPDYIKATLRIEKNQVKIDNGGCGVALGFCKNDECEWLCREYYRHARKPKPLVAMSNTWGDGNGFSRICRDFVMQEIDAGEKIGVDIVQIDDGWQTGSTANLSLRDQKGRRFFPQGFWDLKKEKFPDMKEITKYAKEKNVKAGLWFAPDSHNCYALRERDAAVLKKAYDEWGFRFFKLDMFWIENEEERKCFLELLRDIYSFGDDVAVQLDVTRNLRTNYLYGREYGTIFVENRYTKTANFFPYRALKNLWMISKFVPSAKFQFELVNPDLNKNRYEKGDVLAPKNYDMDYLFACVMLSNPLFWMEMQFLSDKRKAELERVTKIWKEKRDDLYDADVEPIGESPSGTSYTGFCIRKKGKPKYLLAFREFTNRKKFDFDVCAEGKINILATNAKADVKIKKGKVAVSLSKKQSYVFAEII